MKDLHGKDIKRFDSDQVQKSQMNITISALAELAKLDISTHAVSTKFQICDVYDTGYCEIHGNNVGGCAQLIVSFRVSPGRGNGNKWSQ